MPFTALFKNLGYMWYKRFCSPAWLPMLGRITGMAGGISGPGRARTSALTQRLGPALAAQPTLSRGPREPEPPSRSNAVRLPDKGII